MVANTGAEGLRQRNNVANKVVVTEEGKEMDERLDKHETFEHFHFLQLRNLSNSIGTSSVVHGVSLLS